MVKIIKKAKSKWFLLFLLGLMSIGVQGQVDGNLKIPVNFAKVPRPQTEYTDYNIKFEFDIFILKSIATPFPLKITANINMAIPNGRGTTDTSYDYTVEESSGYQYPDTFIQSILDSMMSFYGVDWGWTDTGSIDVTVGGYGTAPTAPPCEITSCPVGFNLVACECAEIPKKPCDEVKKNILRANNVIIAKQNNEIRKLSTSKEFGAEQNLTTFPPASVPVFMDVPVRTDKDRDSFTPKFTWNATDGFTIGVSHGHPNGSGPSLADILYAYAKLSNPDLIAGGDAAIAYYKDNFTITVVTKNETFVVNVINWTELGLLYTKYYESNTTRKTMKAFFKDKGQEYLKKQDEDFDGTGKYEQTIYAALKLYSKAISISKFDKTTLKYTPLVVDAFGEVKSQPCYN